MDHPGALRGFRFRRAAGREAEAFPFNAPALRELDDLRFERPITFFAGENGSGKSTLLEALAIACRVPVAGSAFLDYDVTLHEQRRLAKRLKLEWNGGRPHKGFFLRAEDFFGYVKRLREHRRELEADRNEMRNDPRMAGASEDTMGRFLGPMNSSVNATLAPDGRDWDHRSHGESFLDFFRGRLVPGGLYLMDEPEAALSPQSQLGLLMLMKDGVEQGSQFIVATHSPILLAAPGAAVLSFDRSPPTPVRYDDLESVALYRAFLGAPERYLRHLWHAPQETAD